MRTAQTFGGQAVKDVPGRRFPVTVFIVRKIYHLIALVRCCSPVRTSLPSQGLWLLVDVQYMCYDTLYIQIPHFSIEKV